MRKTRLKTGDTVRNVNGTVRGTVLEIIPQEPPFPDQARVQTDRGVATISANQLLGPEDAPEEPTPGPVSVERDQRLPFSLIDGLPVPLPVRGRPAEPTEEPSVPSDPDPSPA